MGGLPQGALAFIFATLLSTICAQVINSQGNSDILGYCHCNYSSTVPGRHTIGCNSSRVCPVMKTNTNSFMACLTDYVPRYTGSGVVDIYQKCVIGNLQYGSYCNPSDGDVVIDNSIIIKVVQSEPKALSICCITDFCNTEDVLHDAIYERELLGSLTTATTLSTQTQPTDPGPPLYALIAIPVLSVLVVGVVILIVVSLCIHYALTRKNSDSSDVPTITSQDSSSCGDQSINNLPDYSGSGAGKPLLVHRSIAGQITLHELIGKGRYGEVWKGLYKCDEVAVKIFHTREEASWAHECNIYKTCLFRHPNILRFIASDNRDIGVQVELWLITEFCEFGSLYDLLVQRSLEPADMINLAYTASCGLEHLHSEIFGQEAKPAIVHRDLKSRNILVKSDYTCCIGDLGLALRYDRVSDEVEDPPSKRVGTKRYLAPEIIDENVSFKHFESYKRADIYSFGLVMWEIAMRGEVDGVAEEYQMPYQNLVPTDPSFEDMKKTVVVEKRRPTIPNRWTQQELFRGVSKLIQQCWLHDSEARLTSYRLKKSLYNLQKSCISEKKGEEQST